MSGMEVLFGMVSRRKALAASSLLGGSLVIGVLGAGVLAAGCGPAEEIGEHGDIDVVAQTSLVPSVADCVLPLLTAGDPIEGPCPDGGAGCLKYRAKQWPGADNTDIENDIHIKPPPGVTYPVYVDVYLWGPGGEMASRRQIPYSDPPAYYVRGDGGAGGLSMLKVKLHEPCSWFNVRVGVTRLHDNQVMGFGSRLEYRSYTLLVAGSGGWGGRGYLGPAPHGGAAGQAGSLAHEINGPGRVGGNAATATSCGPTVFQPSPCAGSSPGFDCFQSNQALTCRFSEEYSWAGQGPRDGPGFAGGNGLRNPDPYTGDLWGGGGGGASSVTYEAGFPFREDMQILAADTEPGNGTNPPNPHNILRQYSATVGDVTYTALEAAGGSITSGGRAGEGVVYMSWHASPFVAANDDLADAAALGGSYLTVRSDNLKANKQAGEPLHAGNAGGASVWYSWSCPVAGTVTISTAGSTFDTLLGVYTGSAVNALTLVASNDDFGGALQSQVSFPCVESTTYKIAIDGKDGVTGAFTLALTRVSHWAVGGVKDLDADGRADIVWRNSYSGQNAAWFMNGAAIGSTLFAGNLEQSWVIGGLGDLNGDGKADIVWRHTATGACAAWLMNGAVIQSTAYLGSLPLTWRIGGVGDLDGNGKADILWRDTTTGDNAVWFMNGASSASTANLYNVPKPWTIGGMGDFDQDGKADILWRNPVDGTVAVWLMNGVVISSQAVVGTLP